MTQPQSYRSLAANFRSGADSPSRELARRIGRLDAVEPTLKAFVHVARDAARAAAARSDLRWLEGTPLSPIDGMTIGVKDIIETADLPTGQGSPLWDNTQTRRDAAAVQALREAGAVILGKTATTEFAASHTFALTTNPHDSKCTPGGSSSGSAAAVGAGILPAALGTQVVGSTLRPASFCGAVGYKPTFGALNRGGSYDYLSQSALGVIAATPDDAWCVAAAIVRRVGGDPGFVGLVGPETLPQAKQPRRLAVLETGGWSKTTPGARAALEEARERLGRLGVELADRRSDPAIENLEAAIADALPLTLAINAWESAWPLGDYAARNADQLSRSALDRLAQARKMTQDDYRGLLERRLAARSRHAVLAENYDACLTLSAAGAAPEGLSFTGETGMIVAGSLLGGPAISVPLLQDEGLPLGLQLVGQADCDAELMAMADWLWQHYPKR